MRHLLAVLAAAVLFGTTGTAQALAPDSADPLSVGVARMLLGGTVLAVVAFGISARRRTQRTAVRLTFSSLALMAISGASLAAYSPLFFLGTDRNGVAVGTVIALGSAPVMAGVIESAIGRRLPSRRWMIATGAATCGVVMLGLGDGAEGAADPVGVACSLGAALCFAVLANAQRRLLERGWDPFLVVGAMAAGASACTLALLPAADLRWVATPAGLSCTLWLALLTVALGYALFTWGLGGVAASAAATLTLAEPLTAGILGIVLLGERPAPLALAGFALIAVALAALALTTPRRQASPVR